MALAGRLFMNCQYLRHITKPVKWNVEKQYPVRILASGICYRSNLRIPIGWNNVGLQPTSVRGCSTGSKNTDPPPEQTKKVGLIQRLKVMYKDYWYVAVPVHVVTSAIWFGGLYYFVSNGVDILAILEKIGLSETLLSPLRNSGAGYFAITFAMYKVIAPLRYAVTLGGSHFAIKRLTALGLIKPVPSSARIKEMIQEKKDAFQVSSSKYQVQMKEKRNQLMEDMRRYKQQMKDKVKKM